MAINLKNMKNIFIIIISLTLYNYCFCQRTDQTQIEFFSDIQKIEKKKNGVLKLNKKETIYDNSSAKIQYDFGCQTLKNAISIADTLLAVTWINKSASKNYSPAIYKLGIFFKYGIGVSKDMNKAYSLFDLASNKGNTLGTYTRGYMHYKGLGCTQDYKKAFDDFYICANAGNAASMYMLGLCYRNGFGVEKNRNESNMWLEVAIKNGYTYAQQELNHPEPEINDSILNIVNSYKQADYFKLTTKLQLNKFNKIDACLVDDLKNKIFEGFLVKYDYSGQQIVKIEEVQVVSKLMGQNLELNLKFQNKLDISLNGVIENNIFKIQSNVADRADRYINDNNDKLYIESIEFNKLEKINSDEKLIVGNIKSFSTYESEKERPIKLFLIPESFDDKLLTTSENKIIELSVYPNPFLDVCNVRFEILENANCKLIVTDVNGLNCFESRRSLLNKGTYLYPLEISLLPGLYIISLEVDNIVKTIKAIKL